MGQVGVGGRQIGAVITEAGIAVVAPFRLDQYQHRSAGDSPDWESGAAGPLFQVPIVLGRPPDGLQKLASRRGQGFIPALIGRQGEMVQGRPVVAFRIVAAAGQQPVHQGRPIGGECQGIPQVVASFSQPAQHQGRTGWGVQAHPIGQATIAVGVIGQHQGQSALRHRGLAQLHPGAGQLGDPGQPFLIGAKPLQRSQQATAAAGRFFESPHAGNDAAIQFGQGHLQAQVQGPKANAAVLPALTGPGAREHLQHRHPQPLPQGCPQPRLLKAHRSKARCAEHRLDPFTAEPIRHRLLHGRFPQAAHPKRPGYQALLA